MNILSLLPAEGMKRVASTSGGEWAGPCPWCGGRVSVDAWREEAKRRGISTSSEKRAGNVACQRVLDHLLDLGLVEFRDKFCWLAGTAGTAGTVGTKFPVVPGVKGGTAGTHPLRGVPSVPTPKHRTLVPSPREAGGSR